VTGSTAPTHLFLYGADMRPGAVLAAYPGARFVARAWVPGEAAVLPPLPDIPPPPPLPGAARSPEGAVWGILVRLPVPHQTGEVAEATTDDERRLSAVVGTPPTALSDPAAVVAAARYWELPPLYLWRLIAWADAPGVATPG
jgi:hypothetical protein